MRPPFGPGKTVSGFSSFAALVSMRSESAIRRVGPGRRAKPGSEARCAMAALAAKRSAKESFFTGRGRVGDQRYALSTLTTAPSFGKVRGAAIDGPVAH